MQTKTNKRTYTQTKIKKENNGKDTEEHANKQNDGYTKWEFNSIYREKIIILHKNKTTW